MTEQEQKALDELKDFIEPHSGKNIVFTLTILDKSDSENVSTKVKTIFTKKPKEFSEYIAICESSIYSLLKSIDEKFRILAMLTVVQLLAKDFGLDMESNVLFDNEDEDDTNSRSGSANSPTADGE